MFLLLHIDLSNGCDNAMAEVIKISTSCLGLECSAKIIDVFDYLMGIVR